MSIYNNHNLIIIVNNIILVNIQEDSRDPAVRCGGAVRYVPSCRITLRWV